VVSRRHRLRGAPRSVALAWRVRLPGLWRHISVAHRHADVDVRRMWSEDLGHCGHHLSSITHPVVDVVRRRVVRHRTEERRVRTRAATDARVRFLRDRLGMDAEAAASHGAPRPRPTERHRRTRRDIRRRTQQRQTRGVQRQGPGHGRRGTTRTTPAGPGPIRDRRPPRHPQTRSVRVRHDHRGHHCAHRRRAHAAATRPPWATPTNTSTATPAPTPAPNCPACTLSPHCSSAGSPALCTTTSASITCPTTSTSTPSGSTGTTPAPAGCCSTGCCNRPSPPIRTRSTSCTCSDLTEADMQDKWS